MSIFVDKNDFEEFKEGFEYYFSVRRYEDYNESVSETAYTYPKSTFGIYAQLWNPEIRDAISKFSHIALYNRLIAENINSFRL